MTKDSSFIATTTPIPLGGNTIASILFALPGSGISMTEAEIKDLGQRIGPAIEQWLISYASSRNLDLKLPTNLWIYGMSNRALNRIASELQWEQEERDRLAWERNRRT
jgi:hypothetical protein